MKKKSKNTQGVERKPVSFRIKPEVASMLDKIVEKNRRSKTQQLEILIEDEFNRLIKQRSQE